MNMLNEKMTPEALNKMGENCLPGYLGVKILELKPNTARSQMEITSHHIAPNGYLHAASIIALADTTCGNATIAHLPKGSQGFTTIELKSNHLGTARRGSISCVATAQHMGRTTQVWDAVVTDDATGKKIAMFRCTQMILWPKN